MSTGRSVKENQDNTRITLCLNEPETNFPNDVDGNADLFLAASLQFLHRLLAERTLQCAKLENNGCPTSRLQAEKEQEEGNDQTAGHQLYFRQIDQIEEYKRQLRSMENFLSTIQSDAEKPIRNTIADCDGILSNETYDISRRCRIRQNSESTKLPDHSCGSIGQGRSHPESTCPYSIPNYDESRAGVSERAEVNSRRIEGSGIPSSAFRKTALDAASDFYPGHQLGTNSGLIPTWTNGRKDGVQSSTSYADIVRNAVSSFARNCGKKHKTERRKKDAVNRWVPEAGDMTSFVQGKLRNEFQDEVESEICTDSNIPKEIPLRVQLAMETDASPRKPVTLLVKVPKTVFNLLNRKTSSPDTKISSTDGSAETRTDYEPGKRKKRITSVFRNLLKGRRTPSSTIVHPENEKFRSDLSLSFEQTDHYNPEDDRGSDNSRNTSIYELRKSASSDVFEQTRSAGLCCEDEKPNTEEPAETEHASFKRTLVPPTKSVDGYEEIFLNLCPRVISYETKSLWDGKAAGTTWRRHVDDKAPGTEVPSNKLEIAKDLTNYHDEKIIPLRCSEGSPQLGNKLRGISQRDVDRFLKLAAKMRRTQVSQDANNKHVEIPIRIKTTETPLRLRKIPKVSEDVFDHCVFHPVMKSSQEPPERIETQQFLEMLVGTLPECDYFPGTKLHGKPEELPLDYDSVKTGPQNNIQILKNNEDSALDVLLRHIATDAAEKDTTVQTAPKRQLSKISVCCSSESSSSSEHDETPEVETTNYLTASQDEYRVHNHVLNNEPRVPGSPQNFHHCEAVERNYTRSSSNNQVIMDFKSEDKYPGLKIRSSMGCPEVTKNENSNLSVNSLGLNAKKNDRTL